MTSNPSIILYAVGSSVGEGDLVQKAGCCINMEFVDEYGRKSTRKITHPIGNASEARAHLQAAHMALASVIRSMRRLSTVELRCPAIVGVVVREEMGKLCDDSCYRDDVVGNEDVIGEINKWSTFYDKLRFVPLAADDLLGRYDAKQCAESQKGSDTGTVYK